MLFWNILIADQTNDEWKFSLNVNLFGEGVKLANYTSEKECSV